MREMPRNYMIFNNITRNISENSLPELKSDEKLANNFADFFIQKIQKIRDSLEHHPKYDLSKSTTRLRELLSQFMEVSEDEVKKIKKGMTTKSCESDPIPTSLPKQILPAAIPTIRKNNECVTKVWNFCLKLEDCHCQTPFEKKLGLQLVLSNFRPVSKLPFLAKALDKCALDQLDKHC